VPEFERPLSESDETSVEVNAFNIMTEYPRSSFEERLAN